MGDTPTCPTCPDWWPPTSVVDGMCDGCVTIATCAIETEHHTDDAAPRCRCDLYPVVD